ncbi:dicarboxylate transporter/tellurite-resistance protein TehA [Rhizobium sp. 2MFCol3.1]|uniref:dicarboxylate transporter/tellurite-resistance protein TehA n=1 Tax=Rhizobium sp. 2MFCol3.1 TaxID=1246459 RepID=UPI00036D80E0|nr:dicarboxylate transporter/tellurite-resistance protein TehA [Rhizobium sp. 2MFCol3.1]
MTVDLPVTKSEVAMVRVSRLPPVPAAFFGIVLGLAGLGNSWRAATAVWGLPSAIGEAINVAAVIVWLILVTLYAAKWIVARPAALLEAENPVQCCFIGLAGVSTMLIALAVLPYTRTVAILLFTCGAIFTLAFALWRTGILWRGERDPATTTAVLYLPTVAGSFVTAIVAGALGYGDWGQYAFGAGFFSWLAIESVLLNRLLTGPSLADPLRPTLGIQLAPPAVGAVAYLSVTVGAPDMIVRLMLGYALLQALLLCRMLPWISRQPFAASYWAFTFGVTALSTAAIRMVARGDAGPVETLAPVLFIIANLVVFAVAIGTIMLIARGRLLPAAPVAKN